MGARTTVKRWGNSLGVIIPREEAVKNGLKENDVVEIDVRKTVDIHELFGKYKFKKKTLQQVKDEMRKGWR